MQNWLKLGDWNAICDSCGRKFKASSMIKRWDGLFVCKEDYEIRHPQDFLRVRADKQVVPIARPDPVEDNFILVCYLWQRSGYVGLGTVGCMKVGNGSFSYEFLNNLLSTSVG